MFVACTKEFPGKTDLSTSIALVNWNGIHAYVNIQSKKKNKYLNTKHD